MVGDRSIALLQLDFDRPAMRLDELARQRQSKPQSRLATHAFLHHAIEPVEHARQVLRRDAEPLSLMEITASAFPPALSRMHALAVGVGDGVMQHVLNGFAQAARISNPAAGKMPVSSFCAFSAALVRAVSAARHRPAMSTRSISSALRGPRRW